MLSATGDVFDSHHPDQGAWIAVPVSGVVLENGGLAMESKIATRVHERLPGIELALGAHVLRYGNTPAFLYKYGVISWPTQPAEHESPASDGNTTHPGFMCTAAPMAPSIDCTRVVSELTMASGRAIGKVVVAFPDVKTVAVPMEAFAETGLSVPSVAKSLHYELDDRFIAFNS